MSNVFTLSRGDDAKEIQCVDAFDALRSAKVCDIYRRPDGRFSFVEGCDNYYEVVMSKDQLLEFATQLKTIAES